MDKKVKCPDCNGEGGILCPVCGGSKKDPRNKEHVCSYCNGTGVKKCPRCGGRGEVFESDTR